MSPSIPKLSSVQGFVHVVSAVLNNKLGGPSHNLDDCVAKAVRAPHRIRTPPFSPPLHACGPSASLWFFPFSFATRQPQRNLKTQTAGRAPQLW
jgi:hypothetical protein